MAMVGAPELGEQCGCLGGWYFTLCCFPEICAIGRIEGGANGPIRRCSHHPHSPRRRPWSPKGGGGMGGVEELRWELISPSFHHYHTIAIAPLLNS